MGILTSNDALNPHEIANRQGMKEQVKIIEALSVTNEMMMDAVVLPANDGSTMRFPVRTSQPAGKRRRYGGGISSSSSATIPKEDFATLIEDFCEVDQDLADNSPQGKNFTLEQEEISFLEGIGQTQGEAIIYDNRAESPEQTNGFNIRTNTLKAGRVVEVATPGTTGACTSAYLVGWGPGKVHLFYPQGETGSLGIQRRYLGFQLKDFWDAEAEVNKTRPVYQTWFKVHFGVCVQDERYLMRIANIPASASASGEEIIDAMTELVNFAPAGNVTWCLYGNPWVKTAIEKYANKKSNVMYPAEGPWGRPVNVIGNVRLRRNDQILSTEALLTE